MTLKEIEPYLRKGKKIKNKQWNSDDTFCFVLSTESKTKDLVYFMNGDDLLKKYILGDNDDYREHTLDEFLDPELNIVNKDWEVID